MNYLAALLGIALLGAITTASIYRADSISYKAKYDSLKASYSLAADKARSDAAQQEAQDLKQIQSSTAQAISLAQSQAVESQKQLAEYLKRGKASKGTDLGHQCFSVPIPADEIP